MIFVMPHVPPEGFLLFSIPIPLVVFFTSLSSCASDDGEDGDEEQNQ